MMSGNREDNIKNTVYAVEEFARNIQEAAGQAAEDILAAFRRAGIEAVEVDGGWAVLLHGVPVHFSPAVTCAETGDRGSARRNRQAEGRT